MKKEYFEPYIDITKISFETVLTDSNPEQSGDSQGGEMPDEE